MANPAITVCGRLTVEWDGEQLEGDLPGRQGRMIFAYMVLNRSHPVRRDELVEALWADEGLPSGGEALLAPPLSRLRKALGKERLTGRTELVLELGDEAAIDWEEAQAQIAQARKLGESGEHGAAYEAAGRAERILAGGLLPGLEASWIEEHRSELEDLRLQSLELIARSGSRLGRSERSRGEQAARAAIQLAPFRESARIALIEVIEAQGNIAEALRAYDEFRQLLRDELGTFPASELGRVHERLLNAHESLAGKPAAIEPQGPEDEARASDQPDRIARLIDPRVDETELIGREEILDQLHGELDLAVAGDLRIALLAGEGGIGKTRIAAALAAERPDVAVLYGRCEPNEVRPFRVWAGLLRTATRQAGIDLAGVVGADGPILARILPELVRQLDLPDPGPANDVEVERRALFGAVSRMIARLTAARPALIVLDDLHWADRSTLMLLASLAGDNPIRGVLALGLYRDTELPSDSLLPETLINLQRRLPTSRIEVGPLDAGQVGELIRGRVDEKLASVLHDQSAGNPFLLGQVLLHIEETGGDAGTIPAGIRAVIEQRISLLPEGAGDLLRRASLIGREFDLAVLAATTTREEDEIIDLLDAAVAAGLIDESPAVPGRWSFVHALVASSLGEDLSLTRRASVHRAIGEAIERGALGPPERRHRLLAWHFSQAGPTETDRAIRYATLEAEEAIRRLDYGEAVRQYALAVSACEADEPVDFATLAELQLELAESRWRAGDLSGAGQTFFLAADSARESGIPELIARAAMGTTWGSWDSFESDRAEQGVLLREALEAIPPGDSPLRAQLLASLAQILYFSGGVSSDAREMAIEATGMAERVEDPYTFFVSNIAASFLRWEPDGRDSRLGIADRLVSVADASEDPEDLAEALSWRSVVWVNLGRKAEADADIARFDVLATTLPQIQVNQAALHSVRMVREGRWGEAAELITATLARDVPTPARVALTDPLLFMIRAEQLRLGEHLEQVRAMAAQSTGWEHWPTWRMGYYLAMTQSGRAEEVLERVDRFTAADVEAIESRNITFLSFCAMASMVACEIGFERGAATLVDLMEPYAGEWTITGPAGSSLGPVEMHLGELCLMLGRHREAATWLERAAETCEAMNAAPYLAHSRMHLALALERLGNPEPERVARLLDSGRQTAKKLEMKMLLNRVKRWSNTSSH